MFRRFKIGGKILGGYGIALVLLLIVAGVGVLGIRNLNTDVDEIVHVDVPAADAAMEIIITDISLRNLMDVYWINEDPEERVKMKEEFEHLHEEFEVCDEKLREVSKTKEEIEELDAVEALQNDLERVAQEYMDALDKEFEIKEIVDVKMEEYDSSIESITGSNNLSALFWEQAMAANDFLITGDESLVKEFMDMNEKIESIEGYEEVAEAHAETFALGLEASMR